MTVSELIEKLAKLPQDMEVATRTGHNHGANYITRASDWIVNPKTEHHSCDLLVTDSQYNHAGHKTVVILD